MINNKDNNLLILIGPTGVGKTDISIKLAQIITDVEIISADSMQIYKYMDIGTAKPDKSILNTIKHHMVDIVDPAENFDVIQYSKLAVKIIWDVFKRGKIPILAGGSGLYISSIINPLFTGPDRNIEYRNTLEEEEKIHGKKYLYDRLSKIDPISASRIKPNDLRRIIRALEVYKSTGKTISYLQKKSSNNNAKINYQIIGFKRNRENLYQRINLRVDRMIKDGFIEEVKMLRYKGCKENLNSMQGLGYKQINKYLNGVYSKEEAINLIKIETRHYAKRQMTWFKNKIKDIEWIDLDRSSENEAISKLKKILQKKVISKLKFPLNMKRIGIDMGSDNLKAVVIEGKNITSYLKKIDGKPIYALKETLDEIITKHSNEAYLGITGVNSISLSDVLNEKQMINESIAIKKGITSLDLDIKENEKFAVIDVGASNQRCYEFEKNTNSGKYILENHYLQNKCGAGSGMLLEHMAKRFEYGSIGELSNVANQTEKTIKLSAKCGVFRESDVVHQQQKGTSKEVLAASLYRASADSFKTILSNGTMPEGRVILIGALSLSKAFVKHLIDVCKISSERVIIPKQGLHIGAIGAAIYGQQVYLNDIIKKIEKKLTRPFNYESQGPLIFKKSKIIKPKEDWPYGADIPLACLGIDIGSVSTKAALIAEINGKFLLLAYHYRRTEIDPVGAAIDVINKVYNQVTERGYKIKKVVAGTTGSGRQLTGFIVGASKEHIVDEITAQAAGITTFYPQKEFSIIEFGGQDSKFINIDQGVVVDFAMNNACAAGTGALLEKYAMRRGIAIEDFGDIALKADNPPAIDSTCAVLSEQSIIKYEQNNVSLENLCAALTLATARNYLAKVVSGLEIKEKVVFQGATAFNLGQVAALETILGKGIIVPPWPHITGAIGAAKYAYDTSNLGNFRGFKKILNLKYNVGPYECINKDCGNDCNITRAEIKGKEKMFYFIGDRCQRYSAKKDEKQIKPPNLFKERQKIMEEICK